MDRRCSMSGLEEDTIGGFNSMIKKQKIEGEIISNFRVCNELSAN